MQCSTENVRLDVQLNCLNVENLQPPKNIEILCFYKMRKVYLKKLVVEEGLAFFWTLHLKVVDQRVGFLNLIINFLGI